MQTACKLKVDKICKGSIRYAGKVDKDGTDVPLTIYVPKELLSRPPKEEISVSIEA